VRTSLARTAMLALASAGLSVAGMAVLGETACRLFWPDRELIYQDDPVALARVAPSQTSFTRMGDGSPSPFATVNAEGFRGPERPRDASRTLLVLGDSFTFGVGVQDEQTFAARLDRAIGPQTHVWNGGQPGYGVWQMQATLDRVSDVLRPDRVIVVIWQGDFLRQPPPPSEKQAFLRKSRAMKTLKKSVLLTHLVRLWERAAPRLGLGGAVVHLGETQVPADPQALIDAHRRGLEADLPRLRAMHGRSGESGAELLLVFWPRESFADRAEPGLAALLEGELGRFAEAEGIAFVSVQPAMATAKLSDLGIPGDGHPTALAHCLAAQRIAAAIAGLGETIVEPVRCDHEQL